VGEDIKRGLEAIQREKSMLPEQKVKREAIWI